MAIDTIKASAILDGAIDTADIADSAVETAKINASAVTAAKIASDAVTSAKINADAITQAKIADNAVQKEHLISTTQGAGIMMWEHIETKIATSDADNNLQTLVGSNECINLDVSSVKHLYSEYCIKIHWICPTGSTNTHDLLLDTLQGDGSTLTGTSTWYGGGARMTQSSLAQTLGRNGSSTMKVVSNVWPFDSPSNWNAGCVGEINCKGFMAEVTQNIGGASAVNDYHGGAYRPYCESKFQTYDDVADLYVGDIAMCRQNQDMDSDNTTGSNSFGGFSLRFNSNSIDFAKGTSVSIYGLRVASGS